VADLLDPREVFEVFERASVLKGDVRVEALTFSLLDTDGAATALLSVREARVSQLLAADVADLTEKAERYIRSERAVDHTLCVHGQAGEQGGTT
jgi:hypothetical protein